MLKDLVNMPEMKATDPEGVSSLSFEHLVSLIGRLSHQGSPAPAAHTSTESFMPATVPVVAKRKVLTGADESIGARFQSGERVTDLAAAYDMHPATIANCLIRLGINNPWSWTQNLRPDGRCHTQRLHVFREKDLERRRADGNEPIRARNHFLGEQRHRHRRSPC